MSTPRRPAPRSSPAPITATDAGTRVTPRPSVLTPSQPRLDGVHESFSVLNGALGIIFGGRRLVVVSAVSLLEQRSENASCVLLQPALAHDESRERGDHARVLRPALAESGERLLGRIEGGVVGARDRLSGETASRQESRGLDLLPTPRERGQPTGRPSARARISTGFSRFSASPSATGTTVTTVSFAKE